VTAASETVGFTPVFPERHDERLPLFRLIRAVRENTIGTWTRQSYEREIMVYRMLFRPIRSSWPTTLT
jgi:hypothetical protein